ncbi:methionine biosynthesis protein MetW [Aestuariirhabdus sp. Z084]|uniref:methionine biosynthesis protein MetW n=1 Tax=Aestuariirhabdus haliotis TaxID=2918751 RepID=UPI00201B38D6|nr:methionine biosynthesis protein MetW [Aestuariirhabdus haliotis]MCL6414150.1 methionine biosynthesis protein MetW [Aestuariirhabdus haliotis]MCL6418082.1 methionine biosynthesis protein MetW [Aestuariirhabdus haliotis]
MRSDLECIQRWIKPNSRVLDLGCGDGIFLDYLNKDRGVQGYGLEINPQDIAQCVERGVNVIEQDLDKGLHNFSDKSFDTVVMTQALQAVHYPDQILDEMLRVGSECIITFPNFGHWRCRGYLGWRGRMPVSKFMPYTWYNTPNIHFCTFKDFEALCFQKNLHILDRLVVDQTHQGHWLSKFSPNLFGEIAIYHLTR